MENIAAEPPASSAEVAEFEDFGEALASILDEVLDFQDDGVDDGKESTEETKRASGIIASILIQYLQILSEGEPGGLVRELFGNRRAYLCLNDKARELAMSDRDLTESDIAMLSYLMGAGDSGLDLDKADEWDDGMVEKYAQCLRNYLYTYKPEAAKIDPSINPEEEHVGPMAQDIEKVAPDCVKETADGTKVVDGDRLALVNAGVIGDLSREVLELRSRLEALEGRK